MKTIMMRKHMMGRGGMMRGRMGSGPWAESEDGRRCPMCGAESNWREGGRQFLSKEERKELLKEYLEELEAEAKAVKELVEEK
jgi:hypothetical protein